jgi:hypothetical protein
MKKVLEYVNNNPMKALTLWQWLCSKDYEYLGEKLFKIHTQKGIPPEEVERYLNELYDNFIKKTE